MKPLQRSLPFILCFLSGCFLFRSGHLDIPESIRTRYHEGIALYNGEQYDEAEQQFRAILDMDPQAILAKYRLGLTLYQQRKLSDAQVQFQQIIGMSGDLPYGYHGFGLVALQRKNRRFEALNWFRQALRRDPSFVEAQWELAMTRLAVTNGIFGAFSMGQVREEFQRVIEMDPNHPEAYYILGSTYYQYGKIDDADSAIPLFEKEIEVNPNHHDARYQLGLAYIDVERIREGITTLESIRTVDPEWTIRIDRAIAEARLRNSLVGADSIFIVLHMLPEEERRLYFDLKTVLPTNEKTQINQLKRDDVASKAFEYWKAHDPTPSTVENERFVEHCRRVAYSRRYFGRGLWPWDTRGEVYIRYGQPDTRKMDTSDASLHGFGATAQFGIRQVERWTYEHLALTFEFVDQGSNLAFHMPPVRATGDIASVARNAFNDPGVGVEKLAESTPAVYKTDYENGEPLRYSYSLAVYRGAGGSAELEVDYAVPATELSFEDRTASLETSLVIFDTNWKELKKTVEQKRLRPVPNADRTHQVALYRRTLTVTPGQHHFAIQITDKQSGRTSVVRQPLQVQTFVPDRLALSDIRLVSRVEDNATGIFVRGRRRLTPNPAGVFAVGRPVTLYFEVYNLMKNEVGRTAADIEYTVFPLSGDTRPMLTASGQPKIQATQSRESALLQKEEGTEETLNRDVAIQMTGVKPGRYVLRITVNDLNRNQSVNSSVLFRFVPWE